MAAGALWPGPRVPLGSAPAWGWLHGSWSWRWWEAGPAPLWLFTTSLLRLVAGASVYLGPSVLQRLGARPQLSSTRHPGRGAAGARAGGRSGQGPCGWRSEVLQEGLGSGWCVFCQAPCPQGCPPSAEPLWSQASPVLGLYAGSVPASPAGSAWRTSVLVGSRLAAAPAERLVLGERMLRAGKDTVARPMLWAASSGVQKGGDCVPPPLIIHSRGVQGGGANLRLTSYPSTARGALTPHLPV